MDIAISTENVCKDFNDGKVLKDVNHQFETGIILGIIGKSVLFKCICVFMLP